jgi:hypothetical protein
VPSLRLAVKEPACGTGISTSLEMPNHPCFLPSRTNRLLWLQLICARKDGMKFQQRYTSDITRHKERRNGFIDITRNVYADIHTYPRTLNCEIFSCYTILRIK